MTMRDDINEKELEQFNADLQKFFLKFEEAERSLIDSFRNSQYFDKLLDSMKRSSKYSLFEIEEAYKYYKEDVEKNTEKVRAKVHADLEEFKTNLAKTPFFREFSQSLEYRQLMLNSSHSIEQIKMATDEFEKRTFLENLSYRERGGFEGSEFYRNLLSNPSHTFSDLRVAYMDFQCQQNKS